MVDVITLSRRRSSKEYGESSKLTGIIIIFYIFRNILLHVNLVNRKLMSTALDRSQGTAKSPTLRDRHRDPLVDSIPTILIPRTQPLNFTLHLLLLLKTPSLHLLLLCGSQHQPHTSPSRNIPSSSFPSSALSIPIPRIFNILSTLSLAPNYTQWRN
jgi:hypothetical protein